MASSIKDITITNVGATIEALTINISNPNVKECYSLTAVKSIVPIYNNSIGRQGILNKTTYPFKDQLEVVINFHNEHSNSPLRFDIQTVSNQPGWTPDLAGLDQAVTDICGWLSTAISGGGGGGGGDATAANQALQLAQETAIAASLVRSNLERIKKESNDMIKTLTWFAAIHARNPSGNKNIDNIVYSSVLLGLSVTETFSHDSGDDAILITLT